MSFVCFAASQPNAYLFFLETDCGWKLRRQRELLGARFVQGFGIFHCRAQKTSQEMNFLEHSLGSGVYKPAEVSLCAFFAKYKAKRTKRKTSWSIIESSKFINIGAGFTEPGRMFHSTLFHLLLLSSLTRMGGNGFKAFAGDFRCARSGNNIFYVNYSYAQFYGRMKRFSCFFFGAFDASCGYNSVSVLVGWLNCLERLKTFRHELFRSVRLMSRDPPFFCRRKLAVSLLIAVL